MSKTIPGNPQIVAENETHYVIRRGEKHSYYAVIRKGSKLSEVKKWGGQGILASMTTKADFDLVHPPKPYTE